MLTTTPNKAVSHIKMAYKAKQPIFIWGSPGVGKSDSARQACDQLGIDIVDIRASQMDPVDLRGIPHIDNGETTWAKPDFLPTDGNGILFLDEMNSAAPSVQAALYQLILDRQLGNYVLPDGWICMGAGNKDTDRGVTNRMPTPLRNRFGMHMTVEVSLDDWVTWAINNNVEPQLVSYLKYKPDNLYKFNPSSDDKAFATPRSWSFVDKWLKVTSSPDEALPYIMGAVGEATAIDFKTHLDLHMKLPSLDKILKGEKVEFDQTDPAICYSLAASIGHRMDAKNAVHAVKFLQEELSPEYGVMGIKYALEKTPALVTEKTIMSWATKNKNLFVK